MIPKTHSFVLDLIFQYIPRSRWKTYKVRSLYYDTLDLQSYHQKKSGDYYRKKFRLRYYDDFKTNLFVEVKEKEGQVVRKTREKIGNHLSFNFLTSFSPLSKRITEQDIQSGFLPTLWTHYERQAIEMHSNSYFRITVDRNIGLSQFNNTMLKSETGPVFQGFVVEVKHSPFLKNGWLKAVSKHLKSYRSNFSKYEWALENGKKGIKWI